MASDGVLKIRTLPRPGEDPPAEAAALGPSRRVRALSVALIVLAAFGFALLLWPAVKVNPRPVTHELSSHTPARDPMKSRLDRFVEDVRLKEENMRQRRELENLRANSPTTALDLTSTAPESVRPLGVTMDSENTADRLYRELNDRPTLNVDALPETRINARLEKNKWVNELDRRERAQFIRSFIKSAYDRGYEVQLDQNLVVTSVRPLQNRVISLDQAIDRASNPGP